jgi:hypothetical protein
MVISFLLSGLGVFASDKVAAFRERPHRDHLSHVFGFSLGILRFLV